MQPGAAVGTESYDIAGVGRDLGLEQGDMKQTKPRS
jgi:hypothetical protein